jgi:hypothetical protein
LALVAIPDVGDIQIAPLNPAERAIRVDGLLDGPIPASPAPAWARRLVSTICQRPFDPGSPRLQPGPGNTTRNAP